MGSTLRVGFLSAAALFLAACSNPTGPPVFPPYIDGTFGAAALQENALGLPQAAPFRSEFSTPGIVHVDYDLDGESDQDLAYDLAVDGVLRVKGVPVAEVTADGQLMIGGNLDPDDPLAGLTIGAAVKSVRGIGTNTFAGKYVLCTLGGDTSAGTYFTRRQLGTADGIEFLTTGILAHSDGLTGSAVLPYSVVDGSVFLPGYVGAVTVEGRVAVLSMPSNPHGELVVAIRKSTRLAQMPLSGTYVGYDFRHDAGVSRTARISLRADGAGNATLSEVTSDGTSLSDAFAIDTAVDGVVVFDGGAATGIVSEDGRVLAMVDTDPSDGGIGFLLALRKP